MTPRNTFEKSQCHKCKRFFGFKKGVAKSLIYPYDFSGDREFDFCLDYHDKELP